MTTTTLRVPIVEEAIDHLHGFTRQDNGPSERLARLGALHGYLIATGAYPRDILADARQHPRAREEHPSDTVLRIAARESLPLVDGRPEIYWPDLSVEPVYLSGVLFGYAQGTSERDDATACAACGRRVCTELDEDASECPYNPGSTYCDSTEHRENCGNVSDCFDTGE